MISTFSYQLPSVSWFCTWRLNVAENHELPDKDLNRIKNAAMSTACHVSSPVYLFEIIVSCIPLLTKPNFSLLLVPAKKMQGKRDETWLPLQRDETTVRNIQASQRQEDRYGVCRTNPLKLYNMHLRNKGRKHFLGQKKGEARKTAVKLKFLFLTMFLP